MTPEAMRKILTATAKELLLLARDRTGLLILFVMPAILVIVITLVQENVLELSGQQKTEILFLDRDGGVFASTLRSSLRQCQVETRIMTPAQDRDFHRLINDGRYQAGVIIAAGTSERLLREMARRFNGRRDPEPSGSSSAVPLTVLFDPAALAGFRAGIIARMQMATKAAEMEMMSGQLGKTLAEKIGNLPSMGQPLLISESSLKETFGHSFTRIDESPTSPDKSTIGEITNPVNRNVPAWALFGMFFTAIPIAGTILAERRSGIAIRLAGMPVSPLQLLAGKVAAYLAVCLCQFGLIVLIGIHLFPHLGLPSFTLPEHPITLLPLILACSLAACGFGTFLGSYCRSYEQASTLGSTLVVIAAALGGVMVPVYAMPQLMQKISIVSPLSWGVNAFVELLVRHGHLSSTAHDLARLLIFSLAMIILSWKHSAK